jgi:hypothetical protein
MGVSSKSGGGWERDFLHPLLIVVSGGSLVSALAALAASSVPAFPLFAANPVIIFLICIEAYLTARYTHAFRYYRAGFHLREWLIIGLILEGAVLIQRGGLMLSPAEPGVIPFLEALLAALIFNPVYLLNLAVIYLSWRLVNLCARDFFTLELLPGPGETAGPGEDVSQQFKKAQFVGNLFYYRRIVSRFLKGAIALAVSLTLYWQLGSRFLPGGVSGLKGSVAYGMIYLVCALVLISRAHYLQLKVSWLRERISPRPGISAGWNRALAAILLPFSLLGLLLPVVSWPISLKGLAEYISYLVGRLIDLFNGRAGPEAIREVLKRRSFSPDPEKRLPFFDISDYVTLLAIVLFFIFFGLMVYLAWRKGRLGRVGDIIKPLLISSSGLNRHMLLELAKRLLLWLMQLPGFIAALVADLFAEVRDRPSAGPGGEGRSKRPRVWRGKTPIARLYVKFLQLMDKKGLRYSLWMTAYEFAEAAATRLEQGEEDIWFISHKFVEARYGLKPITKQELKDAAHHLKRLQAIGKGS